MLLLCTYRDGDKSNALDYKRDSFQRDGTDRRDERESDISGAETPSSDESERGINNSDISGLVYVRRIVQILTYCYVSF